MSKTLLHRLFGLGKIPKRYRPTLEQEGFVLLDEGIGGTVTFRNFRAPGRRHSWRKKWFTGSLALSGRHFAAFTYWQPVVFVPLDDPRIAALECSVESEDRLCIAFDPSAFNDNWSGRIEVRFKTPRAREFAQRLAG